MSAHVLPKAQAFADHDVDEDEKTTIESGWEEEASTTVEQGEVAEKLRALGSEPPVRQRVTTGVTSTNATSLDEPTVDDQHANALISVITPPTRAIVMARLVVTQGNDSGQELEIRPDKTYTIGRAIDNDLVLTDISVSRKHFDLRNEEGAWVVIDRGSGNGTVVNGAIEDQPFMLASGDLIEIGNTIFRFDLPNSVIDSLPPPRIASPQPLAPLQPSFEVDMDEDEPSTVAGKALREIEQLPPPQAPPPPQRPKTLPPPAPLRARMPTAPPYSSPHNPPQPSTTLPLPQMANRPVLPPQAMLGAMALPATTLPGQGMGASNHVPHFLIAPQHGVREPYSYPNGSDMIAQQRAPSHPQMVVRSNSMVRDAPSTTLVPPTPYNGSPAIYAPQPYHPPQLSRRTKMIAGGAALTLFAAIATVAIVKGAGGKPSVAAPAVSDGSTIATKPSVTPILPDKAPPKIPPPVTPPIAPKVEPKVAVSPPVAPVSPKLEPKIEPKIEPKVEPKIEPKVEPKVTVQPKLEPKVAVQPKVEPKHVEPKLEPKHTEKVAVQPRLEPKHTEPKLEPKVEPKHTEKRPPKRIAAGGDKLSDTSGFKTSAAGLYRQKNFAGAAELLKKAAATLSNPDDVKELTNLASTYDQFGRAYNVGMAPGTSAKDAYAQLRKAIGLDFNGNYKTEISGKLGEIAPTVANSFMAKQAYGDALTAVRLAESLGVNNDTTQTVRKALDQRAALLINEATKELDSNAADAKEKLTRAQTAVEPKNPLYLRAGKLLAGL